MRLESTDPIVILAIVWTLGYCVGRLHSRRQETIFTFENPDGTIITARANTGGRKDNETPNSHVDFGE